MRKTYILLSLSSGFLFSSMVISGCKKSTGGSPDSGPEIASFSPTTDTIGGTVIITGSGFSSTPTSDIVTFNGVTAVVSSASANKLQVAVPDVRTIGPVYVSVNGKTAVSLDNFTPVFTPSISSFSPPVAGTGYPVIIKGANFSPIIANNVVMINGAVSTVQETTGNQLSITVPVNASTGKISVKNGQLTGISSDSIIIKKLVVTTLAGTGQLGSTDGPGNMATFFQPGGIVADPNGNLFIADESNDKIRKIAPDGTVSTYAGVGGSGYLDGPASAAKFGAPFSIALDKDGNLYVGEADNHDIRKISPDGTVSTVLATGLIYPEGIALDSVGDLYVTDNSGNTITKITASGAVSVVAGTSLPETKDGTGSSAGFNSPSGIIYGNDGNFYITESQGNTIRKMTPTGVVTTVAGNGTQGFADGLERTASFFSPASLVMDKAGYLYVTDYNNGLIRIISPSGYVSTVAGQHIITNHSVDGIGVTAIFAEPIGITMDSQGNLYVVDNASNQVRKIVVQ